MAKIGRNDDCPCESKKKYKKCCLSLGIQIKPSKRTDDEIVYIISNLACLLLEPKNLRVGARLEEATIRLATGKSSGPEVLSKQGILNWLNKHSDFNEIKMGEDPPEDLFTENIPFHGGNYVVYPGRLEAASFVLNSMLEALNFSQAEFPSDFKNKLNAATLLMLYISDIVATRSKHTRWMSSPEDFYSRDVAPSSIANEKVVYFSEEKVSDLCSKLDIAISDFSEFTVDINDVELQATSSYHDSIFHFRPFLKIENSYILTNPSGILSGLKHFYLRMSLKYNLIKEFGEAVALANWKRLHRAVRFLELEHTAIESSLQTDEVKSEFFIFDADKLCLLIQVSDLGKQYDEKDPFGGFDCKETMKFLESNLEQVIEKARADFGNSNTSVLILFCHSSIGRFGLFGLNVAPKNSRFIGISTDNFETLCHQRKFDAIDLWNYAIAYDELRDRGTKITSYSFFDTFSIYQKHQESFYIDDKQEYKVIMAPTDGSLEYRKNAAKLNDLHNIVMPDGKYLQLATRMSGEDMEIPIYSLVDQVGGEISLAVEGYDMPIWISPGQALSKDNRGDLFTICDGIAYWIWQLTPEILKQVNMSEKKVISIKFNINVEIDDFDWLFNEGLNEFLIKFPKNFDEKNKRQDNNAEKRLLEVILKMMSESLFIDKLHDSKICQIIEKVASPPHKKKILSFFTGTNHALHPGVSRRARRIREYNLEKNLENLGRIVQKELIIHNIDEGQIPSALRKETLDVIKKTYLSKVKNIIAGKNKIELLAKLVIENESVTAEREFANLTNATSIACYSSIEEKAKELAETMPKINQAGLSTRFLVEFVLATSLSGSQRLTEVESYELLAAAYGFVNWGMLGDEIRCRVVDHNLSILPTGRIGIDASSREWMDDYIQIKSIESVELQLKHYISEDQRKDEENLEKGFDKAFVAEYEVSPDDFLTGCFHLIMLPFNENTAIFSGSLLELKKRAISKEFKEDIFDKVIRVLSLHERSDWESLPTGYTEIDINPWRFSRRLSFMDHPILILSDQTTIFGPRHLSISAQRFMSVLKKGGFDKSLFKSAEMRSYVAQQADIKGSDFEKVFYEFAIKNTNISVERSVEIAPGKFFTHTEDLGDIDALLIDQKQKKLILVECKDLDPGRTAVEIGAEIDRLLKDNGSERSRMTMHNERFKWVLNNLQLVQAKFDLKGDGWAVKAIFVTSSEIPAPRIREMPMKIFAFTEIARKGLSIILKV